MVPDVATGDPMAMLCLNCARRIVAPRITSKYEGLTKHLKFRSAFTNEVKLTFARIDGLIGSNLPMQAYRNEKWWNNSNFCAHSKGWIDAGWEVQEVKLKEGFVLFRKVRNLPRIPRNRRRSNTEITKPFTPVPVHPIKPKTPSKTKVSKLYARILNLERQRNSGNSQARGFKPKSQHERKLFGSNEKPTH